MAIIETFDLTQPRMGGSRSAPWTESAVHRAGQFVAVMGLRVPARAP
jgi:hypothetical protein